MSFFLQNEKSSIQCKTHHQKRHITSKEDLYKKLKKFYWEEYTIRMLDQGQCVGEFSRYLHNKGQQYVKQRDDKKTTEDLI